MPLPGSVHRRRQACHSQRWHHWHPRRRLRCPCPRRGRATSVGGRGRRPSVPGSGLLDGMHAMLFLLLATRSRSLIPQSYRFTNIITDSPWSGTTWKVVNHGVPEDLVRLLQIRRLTYLTKLTPQGMILSSILAERSCARGPPPSRCCLARCRYRRA